MTSTPSGIGASGRRFNRDVLPWLAIGAAGLYATRVFTGVIRRRKAQVQSMQAGPEDTVHDDIDERATQWQDALDNDSNEKDINKDGENEEEKAKLRKASEMVLSPAPRRFGAIIRLKPDGYRRYRELHDKVWPGVLDRMRRSNIRNFNIYYHKETNTLFQTFEWIGHWKLSKSLSHSPDPKLTNGKLGKDKIASVASVEGELYAEDMAAISEDPVTRSWWKECEACQDPITESNTPPPSEGGTGLWWTPLECVAHCGHWPVAYSDESYDPDFVPLQTDIVPPSTPTEPTNTPVEPADETASLDDSSAVLMDAPDTSDNDPVLLFDIPKIHTEDSPVVVSVNLGEVEQKPDKTDAASTPATTVASSEDESVC